MSNEELVVRIQNGEADLMPVLWAQVEKFVCWRADRLWMALEGRADMELEDLYQCGYIALVEAVATYTPGSGSFSTWLAVYLKKEFVEATGYRTVRERMDPCKHAVSLSRPVGDNSDGLELADTVEDKSCQAAFDTLEEKMWRQQLHEITEEILADLPEAQEALLRGRFYEEKTLGKLADELGISPENVRIRIYKALETVRKSKQAKELLSFYDFDYYRETGLSSFRRTGASVQEIYMMNKFGHKGRGEW